MRGDPTLSMTMDSQGRNTLSNTPSNHSNKERKNSVLTLLNTDGVQDPVRLRKFSISFTYIRDSQGSADGYIENGKDVNR